MKIDDIKLDKLNRIITIRNNAVDLLNEPLKDIYKNYSALRYSTHFKHHETMPFVMIDEDINAINMLVRMENVAINGITRLIIPISIYNKNDDNVVLNYFIQKILSTLEFYLENMRKTIDDYLKHLRKSKDAASSDDEIILVKKLQELRKDLTEIDCLKGEFNDGRKE